jgi:hypothetical protein
MYYLFTSNILDSNLEVIYFSLLAISFKWVLEFFLGKGPSE